MPFRFSLQAIYHLRQSLEHQQELKLRAANQQVAKVRHIIEQIDRQLALERTNFSRDLSAGTTSAELLFLLTTGESLRAQRKELEKEVLRLQALRDHQRRLFEQMRRARETFEILRDHQKREYETRLARKEQRTLDDLFLLRRANPHHG